MPLQDIVSRYIDDVDLVIAEGYKKEDVLKIEIFQYGKETSPLCLHNETIVAIVTDKKVDVDIPQFSMDDAEGVMEFMHAVLGVKT